MVSKKKILIVFGTRPEAIKLAPLIYKLKAELNFHTLVCSTGQHREMLSDVLSDFEINADFDLKLMRVNQSLNELLGNIIIKLSEILDALEPNCVIVHGDTASTLGASIAAFQKDIRVIHIEAGLRSGDKKNPFPEEMNRRLVSKLADTHFAPTEQNRKNLISEGIPNSSIFVTGNTVIDAVKLMSERVSLDENLSDDFKLKYPDFNVKQKYILITCHRRENLGQSLHQICSAINQLAFRYPDINFIFPVHLNPAIREVVFDKIHSNSNVFLTEPVGYREFVYLLSNCILVMTDSGGIQEEAPALNKPVVVMRNNTERQEGLDAGCLVLSGSDAENIVRSVSKLLDDFDFFKLTSSASNPYGDGSACISITEALKTLLR